MTTTANVPGLARLLDEGAIRDAIARFAEATTRKDYEAFSALWAADAEWVIGAAEGQPFERRASGQEEIVSMMHSLRDEREYFVQFAIPGAIEVNGDQASTTCVCSEAARGPGEAYYRTNGIWTDHLQRSERGWVFTSRSYEFLWVDFSAFSGEISWA